MRGTTAAVPILALFAITVVLNIFLISKKYEKQREGDNKPSLIVATAFRLILWCVTYVLYVEIFYNVIPTYRLGKLENARFISTQIDLNNAICFGSVIISSFISILGAATLWLRRMPNSLWLILFVIIDFLGFIISKEILNTFRV